MKKDAWFFINMVLNAIEIMAFMLMLALCLFVATGCSHTKKTVDTKQEEVKQKVDTKIEYRTNTIYTDTGSTTTYYRDSVIFSHDTVIQPIDKIVNRWYRQQAIHDTFYIRQHVNKEDKKKEADTVKEKEGMPFWFWIVVAIAVITIILSLKARVMNWIANLKL
jgi:CHASE3 domain sensor protein